MIQLVYNCLHYTLTVSLCTIRFLRAYRDLPLTHLLKTSPYLRDNQSPIWIPNCAMAMRVKECHLEAAEETRTLRRQSGTEVNLAYHVRSVLVYKQHGTAASN